MSLKYSSCLRHEVPEIIGLILMLLLITRNLETADGEITKSFIEES